MMAAVKALFLLVTVLAATLLLTACSKSDSEGSPTATMSTTGSPTPAASPAASSTATPPADAIPQVATGVSRGTLAFDGTERTYRLFVPKGAGNAKMPLVLALHGGLGSGDIMAAKTRFEALAQQEGFIAVFPDGLDGTWNAGGCCGKAARNNVDDVGFLAALIKDLQDRAPLDPSRVFMTGHSNGAMMSFRFGCEHPEMVRGIAPVAGSLEIPKCAASKGTNLLTIHGDADENHPIDGGRGPKSIANVDFVSMAQTLSVWTSAMACGAPTTTTDGPLTTTNWAGCKDGTVARYIIVAGASHGWPGSAAASGDTPSQALDATSTVWAFFKGLS